MAEVRLVTTAEHIAMQKDQAIFALKQSRQNENANWELYKRVVNVDFHVNQLRHFHVMFHITNVSQRAHVYLVRHVFTTPVVQSLRYTSPADHSIAQPESFCTLAPDLAKELAQHLYQNELIYRKLLGAGVKKEDACYMLPQGIKINMTFETNVQQLRHIIEQRGAPAAHWEVRDIVEQMAQRCKEVPYLQDII